MERRTMSGPGSRRLESELRFRQALPVTEIRAFRSGGAYPVCPRCRITLEREYQNFCDRCGQRLDWSQFHRAAVRGSF